MRDITVSNSLGCLSVLEDSFMVGTDHKGGYIAYLDFGETLLLEVQKKEQHLATLTEPKATKPLSFSGWVGYFGYEFLAAHAGVQLEAPRDLSVPEGFFARPETILQIREDRISIESTRDGREDELAESLKDFKPKPKQTPTEEISCNLSFEEYGKIFAAAKEAILDGETYQIKISQRHESSACIDPVSAFSRLHDENPSPEAFQIKLPDLAIVSCSPEVVIDKQGDRIVTRPIGGTYERSVGSNDREVVSRFLSDSKEVAEHNMLVDLERNDLSSICEPGSVRISRFREVESYSHLHHLVSTIEGRLYADAGLPEILSGMLPGGTITGCPKIRTMELIDKLEPTFRGPYTGSFGTIGDDGSIHLNLIIRALLATRDKCYAQAGGGIVVDSCPEYEYRENALKAQALLELLQ